MSVVPISSRRVEAPFPGPAARRKHKAGVVAPRTGSAAVDRRAQARAKSIPLSLVAARFVLLASVTYMVSSLAGHVMVESVRNEGTRYTERAVEARRSEAQLRSRINELTNLGTVESWAESHGFLAPGQAPASSD